VERVIFHGVRIDNDPRRGRDAELWIVTRAARYWPDGLSWSACFDLHAFGPMGLWPGLIASREQTIDWYRKEPAGGRPIYMIERHDSVPASKMYPLGEVMMAHALSEDGTENLVGCRMFGCTLDYLFGLALMSEGLKEIILNGIGMSDDPGHHFVHRTLLYWIGLARGMGVAVTIDRTMGGARPGYAVESCYSNNRQLYGYEMYGYEDLESILKFFAPRVPTNDPDIDTLTRLAKDWRKNTRPQPWQYADELEHVLAALQRRALLELNR